MENLRQDIGERIRQYREFYGKSQKEFAKMLSIKQQSLSKYENGSLNLPDEVKLEYLRYGVNLTWLLTGQGEMTKSNDENQREHNRHQDVENSIFRETFPDVHKMWEENRQLLKKPSGKGCELCDILHSLDEERKTKLKGYAEALQHEQNISIENE